MDRMVRYDFLSRNRCARYPQTIYIISICRAPRKIVCWVFPDEEDLQFVKHADSISGTDD